MKSLLIFLSALVLVSAAAAQDATPEPAIILELPRLQVTPTPLPDGVYPFTLSGVVATPLIGNTLQ